MHLFGLGGVQPPLIVVEAGDVFQVPGHSDCFFLYPAERFLRIPATFVGAGPSPPPEYYAPYRLKACTAAFKKVQATFEGIAAMAASVVHVGEGAASVEKISKAIKTLRKVLSDASDALVKLAMHSSLVGMSDGSEARGMPEGGGPKPLKKTNKLLEPMLTFPSVESLLLLLG